MEVRDKIIEYLIFKRHKSHIKQLFDEVAWRHLTTYSRRYCRPISRGRYLCRLLNRIYYNNEYVVAEYEILASYDKIEHLDPYLIAQYRRRTEHLVIGLRDRFVNIGHLPISRFSCVKKIDDVEICEFEYPYVNADYEEVTIVPDGRIYRVQGDVVVITHNASALHNGLHTNLANVVADAVTEAVAQIMALEMGVDIEHTLSIPMRCGHREREMVEKLVDKILLRLNLADYVSYEVWTSYGSDVCNMRFVVDRHVIERAIRGEKFGNLIDHIVEKYKELFSELQKTDDVITLGNHVIKMKRVTPLNFVAEVDIDIYGVKRRYRISATSNRFYADKESELEIVHDEHGITRVHFAATGVYELGHVAHRASPRILNSVATKRLEEEVAATVKA